METPDYRFENGGLLLDQHYIFSIFGQTSVNTPLYIQHHVNNRENYQRDSSLPQKNDASSINITTIKCETKKGIESVSCALQ